MIPQLWADVKYHVPTGFGFSPKASGFYPFGDATALTGEGDVGAVVWLIQVSAWNQTCHSTNDRCEALASLKGCFFCFSPPVFFHWSHHPPTAQYYPTPKRLTKTDSQTQTTTCSFTENQQVAEIVVFLERWKLLARTSIRECFIPNIKNQMQDIFLLKNGLSKLFD